MGTWGEGLYDNDSALDELGSLVGIDGEERDAVRLAVRIGLLAWLDPGSVTYDSDHADLKRRTAELAADLERLPADTRAALEALLADPKAATATGSRTPEAVSVIGSYCDGPRIDALLRFPGAQPVIDELGERAAKLLDRHLAANVGLYEIAGTMSALGVLIELAQAGLFQPAVPRVVTWRAGFTAIDKSTKSERGFWWKYVRRVNKGFDILAPGTAPPPKPSATRPRVPATPRASASRAAAPRAAAPAKAGSVERYRHAKFGTGTLLGRSGTGDEERLEIRFDGDQIRKILAKFVTKVED
jgi:hypothetical protein